MTSPNIIFIVVDSLRADHIGLQHNGSSLTPCLDRFAAESVSFTQAISQGPSSRPSMSAMLSSTYPSMYGGHEYLSPERPILQDILRKHGYHTLALVTKGDFARKYGWKRAFDTYDQCMPETEYQQKVWLRAANGLLSRLGYRLAWPRYLQASIVMKRALHLLSHAQSPFFMWLHLMDVHWPFRPQSFTWSAEVLKHKAADEKLWRRIAARSSHISPNEVNDLKARYRDRIRYTDEKIGRFLAELQKMDRLDNTLIIITADHGDEFGEHGVFLHDGWLYDTLLRVPLIIHFPRNFQKIAHQKISSQVRLVDLVPTIIEIVGDNWSFNKPMLGQSLLPLLNGANDYATLPAFSESPRHQNYSWRWSGWKYIETGDGYPPQLYNVIDDPGEQQDLSQSKPDLTAEMAIQLHKFRQEIRSLEVVC